MNNRDMQAFEIRLSGVPELRFWVFHVALLVSVHSFYLVLSFEFKYPNLVLQLVAFADGIQSAQLCPASY